MLVYRNLVKSEPSVNWHIEYAGHSNVTRIRLHYYSLNIIATAPLCYQTYIAESLLSIA